MFEQTIAHLTINPKKSEEGILKEREEGHRGITPTCSSAQIKEKRGQKRIAQKKARLRN